MSLNHSSKTWPKTWRGKAAAGAAALLTCATTLTFATPVQTITAVSAPTTIASARTFAGGLTLDEAVTQAEKRYNAKVVKAETRQEGGKTVYELRLLSEDGRVWTIHVDAATGAGL